VRPVARDAADIMAAMPRLSLPDDVHVELPEGEPVGAGMPKDALAARVDGELRDLSFVPGADAAVEPVTAASDDGLHVLRHSAAHILAQAVCDLYPGAKYAIGPAVADGFYYDFDLPETIGKAELAKVDRRMRSSASPTSLSRWRSSRASRKPRRRPGAGRR
jgi:hypothetical protein